jgi:lipoprotein-anchoring transpeptidase ErfK/SrfK
VACTEGGSPPAIEVEPESRIEDDSSLVATARGDDDLAIYASPGARDPERMLANPRPSGTAAVMLVVDDQQDWLEVLLPARPNESTGWVRADDIRLSRHDYRITVDLDAHRLKVFRGDDEIADEVVAVGTVTYPTPGGRYYTTELLRQPDPGGAYGPYAYGLSGYSEVLTEFAGGDGQLGLHGTNEPESLGTDVSHGCIRMRNEAIELLVQELPLGVPVSVRA